MPSTGQPNTFNTHNAPVSICLFLSRFVFFLKVKPTPFSLEIMTDYQTNQREKLVGGERKRRVDEDLGDGEGRAEDRRRSDQDESLAQLLNRFN